MIYQEMAGVIAQKPMAQTGFSETEKERMAELDSLKKKITVLERTAQVDKAAQDELRKELTKLEKENLALREELGFYQNIMGAAGKGRGLKIQALRLESLNDKQRYRFELILTRIVKGGRVASGDISIILHGNSSDGQSDLNLKDLMKVKGKGLHYEIKHFKKIEGAFILPTGFVPEKVEIIVQPDEMEAKAIEKVYNWKEVII